MQGYVHFFLVHVVFVYFQRAELVLYKGIASARHRGVPAADSIAEGMGNMGVKSLKRGKKLFQSTIFYTISPKSKYQKAKWFKENNLGQGIPEHLLLKKCVLKQTATTEPPPMHSMCSEHLLLDPLPNCVAQML